MRFSLRRALSLDSVDGGTHNLTLLRIPSSFLDILIVGAFANWASGAAMHRKITRQSRWNLRRLSDKAIPNQAPGMVGEGVDPSRRGQERIAAAQCGPRPSVYAI